MAALSGDDDDDDIPTRGGCFGALVSETFDVSTGVLFRAATIFWCCRMSPGLLGVARCAQIARVLEYCTAPLGALSAQGLTSRIADTRIAIKIYLKIFIKRLNKNSDMRNLNDRYYFF